MSIIDTISKIEAALVGRSFGNSVIAVGQNLYTELQNAGKVQAAQVAPVGLPVTHTFDTYEGRFMITRNPNMPIDAFRVGP